MSNSSSSSVDLSQVVKAYDVRGLVGSQLTDRVTWALGAAFAEELASGGEAPAEVIIGHDMRDSSPELAAAFGRGVASRQIAVLNIGLCSTDGLYFASGSRDSPGAMFTASHNPASYNGIKLCRAGARPVSSDTGLIRIRERAEQLLTAGVEPSEGANGRHSHANLLAGYARHLRSLVDLRNIRPLRIVVDAGNGMAGLTTTAVLGTSAGLGELPIEIEPLYFELDGNFPNHEANPLEPANLVDLQAAVVKAGADLGLAFDGDADRCFVVDETGAPVSPSAITALVASREIAKEVAAGRSATVIHNLITSRAVPEIVGEGGATALRTRVGHSFIKAEMADANAIFGGEHSAHYYFRDFWFADTGMLAAMHVLAALGEQDEPLSTLGSRYERYHASGEINTKVAEVAASIAKVEAVFGSRPGVSIDRLDGVTFTHEPDSAVGLWWFNLRPSNTEPLLRLNAEAAEPGLMAELRDEVLGLIRS